MSKVTFTPPKGVVPEGTNEGDEFDLVTTYKLEKNGSVCMTVMGDQQMPGYKDDEKPTTRQYKDEAAAMVSSQTGGADGS